MTTSTSRSFISTAIPFVNARPHVGFAYELVLADVLARHRRRRARGGAHFVTGTDDHSLKNVAAAVREGIATRALVDRNTAAFRAIGATLDVSNDDFVATSSDPRHRGEVEWLWRACAAAGDLYKRAWHGRYCAGCEAFVEDDVVVCAEHGTTPEPVREENWFFRLSRWREAIRDAITSGRLRVVPEAARNETLAFLDGEVRDVCVSRDAARANGWGIPVPDDPSQVIYVWFDALTNYVTSIGRDGWCADVERTHVIGKGITRFHAVYWPAFLLSAGLPLPDRIFVHGYLTVDGEKIAKSGKHVEVPPIVEQVGVDALRWYFARRCRTNRDADVSLDEIIAAHDGDLADGLGNLVQRCSTLAVKLGCPIEPTGDGRELVAHATALSGRVDAALDSFLLDDAAGAIVEVVDRANRYLERTEPWRLARTDPAAAAKALHAPLAVARVAADELAPFVPRLAAAITERLRELRAGAPPVPRLRRAPG